MNLTRLTNYSVFYIFVTIVSDIFLFYSGSPSSLYFLIIAGV